MRQTVEKVKHLFVKRPSLLVTDEAYQLASLRYAPEMADVIWEVKRAFAQNILPEASPHGACGTFFLKSCEHQPIAVFKRDQYRREVAAFRLDHERFAGVPPTVVTTLEHPIWGGKATGSCQYFMPDTITVVEAQSADLSHFSATCVRRIASLDIRLMNEDRHTSNILVSSCRRLLTPIDHGFIFAQDLSGVHFDWLPWEQAGTPFNDRELSYISFLDPQRDRNLLIDELGIEERRANRLFVATVLLQMGALRRFTALELGKILSRKRLGLLRKDIVPSYFEMLLEKLKERNPPNWTIFSRIVYEEVQRTLDDYEKTAPERG